MFDFIKKFIKQDNVKTLPGQRGMSIEQAGNYLKDREKTLEKDTKERMKDKQPSVATPQDRKKFLKYCISLMTHPNDQDAKALLIMRAEGMTYKSISYYSRVPEDKIKILEGIAIKKAKDAIAARRTTGIPIIGGR